MPSKLPCPKILLTLALAAGPLLVAPAAAPAFLTDSETLLLSRNATGGFPNGPSRNPAFSQDKKVNLYAAFESDASDIVEGDSNGTSDIFVTTRDSGSYDPSSGPGQVWRPGTTALVSKGLGGAPANGPSHKPDMDGDQRHTRPHCVAFISAADNLVANDNNGKPDAFVANLDTGAIRLVSVSTQGAQSDGETFDVQVDGACGRVAFTSDASNLALTSAKKLEHKRAVTTQPPGGTRQVYVHIFGKETDNKDLLGVTFLASASSKRVAGNGSSYDAQLGQLGDSCPAHCGTVSGDTVAFTSEADNLVQGDGNGATDVFRNTLFLPTQNYKQRNAGKPRLLQRKTTLVSRTPGGSAANAPSAEPAISDSGRFVSFATLATDIVGGDDNNVKDVLRAEYTGHKLKELMWVSRWAENDPPRQYGAGQRGNGPSGNPYQTRPGIVFYESDSNNFQERPEAAVFDRNGVTDVFFWNHVNRYSLLESVDSTETPSGNAPTEAQLTPTVLNSPSTNPAGSYYGNNVMFESSNPVLDLGMGNAAFSGLARDPDRAARLAQTVPSLRQIYVHFVAS